MWGSFLVLPGYPSFPPHSTQNSVDSEKALGVWGMKHKGGSRTRKRVIWNVLRPRVLRHDRAALKIKAKRSRLGRFPPLGLLLRAAVRERTPLQIPLLEIGLQHEMMKM